MSRNRKKPTNKELVTAIYELKNDLIFLDQRFGEVWRNMMNILANYIEFKKDDKKFDSYMKKKVEKAKKEAEKEAKSQENKAVTAKEKSEVPVK